MNTLNHAQVEPSSALPQVTTAPLTPPPATALSNGDEATLDIRVPVACFRQLLIQTAPLVLRFPNGLTLDLRDPYDVELVPDLGLRVSCSGFVEMETLGMAPNTAIRKAVILMRADVSDAPERLLTVDIRVLEADLALVPGFVERSIVDGVNDLLGGEEVTWTVDLDQVVAREIALNPIFETLAAFRFAATQASFEVTSEAVVARVRLDTGFVRAAA